MADDEECLASLVTQVAQLNSKDIEWYESAYIDTLYTLPLIKLTSFSLEGLPN